MKRLCLNSRDELVVLDLDEVAYMEADGNYSNVFTMKGMKIMLAMGIGKLEAIVAAAFSPGKGSPFIRLGRSYIINQNYLFRINLSKQKLILSDFGERNYVLTINKQLLKGYKELVRYGFKTEQ